MSAAIVQSIADKQCSLPSHALSVADIYKVVQDNETHKISLGFIESMQNWTMVVKAEEHLLQHMISGKIYGMHAKGKVAADPSYDNSQNTPQDEIEADKNRLIRLYPTIHMAKGESTSQVHFNAIEEAAEKFVQLYYPNYARPGVERS